MFGFLARSAARVSGRAKRGTLKAGAEEVDAAIRALYRRPGRVAVAVALRLASRVLRRNCECPACCGQRSGSVAVSGRSEVAKKAFHRAAAETVSTNARFRLGASGSR